MRSRYSPNVRQSHAGPASSACQRHALDPRHHPHHVVAVLRRQRRDREAAVAADHGGDAVQRRRAAPRVPQELRVVVRVDVDEARRDHQPVGVDHPPRLFVDLADEHDAPRPGSRRRPGAAARRCRRPRPRPATPGPARAGKLAVACSPGQRPVDSPDGRPHRCARPRPDAPGAGRQGAGRDGAATRWRRPTCSRAATCSTRAARGCSPPTTDRQTLERTQVLVLRDDPVPHLFTPYPEGAPDGMPADHVHPPQWHESAAGVQQVASTMLDLVGATAGRIADRRLQRRDVVRAPQAAVAGGDHQRQPAPRRLPRAQDRRRARVHAALVAHQRGRHRRRRAGAAAGHAPHRSHRDLLPPLLRARRNLQLPRPGVAAHAGAHRRRPVEHQWRRAVRARHRGPPREPRRRDLDRHRVGLRGVRVRRRAHLGRRPARAASSSTCTRAGRTSPTR